MQEHSQADSGLLMPGRERQRLPIGSSGPVVLVQRLSGDTEVEPSLRRLGREANCSLERVASVRRIASVKESAREVEMRLQIVGSKHKQPAAKRNGSCVLAEVIKETC